MLVSAELFGNELEGSPSLGMSRTGGGAVGRRSFLVPWASLTTALYQLWGRWVGTQLINPPAYFPGFPTLICNDVQIKPFGTKITNAVAGGASDLLTTYNFYEAAQVDVTYTPVATPSNSLANTPGVPTVPTGTYMDISGDFAAETTSLKGKNLLFWLEDDEPYPESAALTVKYGSNSFALTWSHCPSPPWGAIRAALGCSNASTFFGYEAEKVLFTQCQYRRSFQVGDTSLWSLSYQYKAREIEWNKQYRFDFGHTGWDDVVDGDGNKLYSTYPFENKFKFA